MDNSEVYTIFHSPDQNTAPVKLLKAHADRLSMKATSYYQAKSAPRNFCKALDDIDEGNDLLQAFDECCAEGMNPVEGANLIVKCAGAMGGALSGPLAATLATRPVKKLADGTGMEATRGVAKALQDEDDDEFYPVSDAMRDRARLLLKTHPDQRPDGSRSVHTKSHYRHRNGRVEYIMDYDSTRHGAHREATLKERSVRGINQNSQDYIRATDSEDRDRILAKARELGIPVRASRPSGANHHGRHSSYPHIYFDSGREAYAVHQALEHNPVAASPTAPAAAVPAATPDPVIAAVPATDAFDIAAAQATQDRLFGTHRAGLLDRRVWMENNSEGHNKFYAIDMRQVGDGKWVVNVAYGRNGAARPTVRTKTDSPVSQAVASRLVDQLKWDKRDHGYAAQDDSATPRLANYAPLDNFQHPSVVPAAQQAVEAAAAARSGGIGAAPAPPARHTRATYELLGLAAYRAGDRARGFAANSPGHAQAVAEAIRTHQIALEAATEAGVHGDSSRGIEFHRNRVSHWTGIQDGGWTSAWTSLNHAYTTAAQNASGTGTGYSAAVSAIKAVIDKAETLPAGITAPNNLNPPYIESLRRQIPGMAGGALLETAFRGAQASQDGMTTLSALGDTMDQIERLEMFRPEPRAAERVAPVGEAITAAKASFSHAMTLAASAIGDEGDAEEALAAIDAAHTAAKEITIKANGASQSWTKIVDNMATAAANKLLAFRPAIARIAALPKHSNPVWANQAPTSRAASDASHAALRTNPASHSHHRIAFDHAKHAAIATWHEARAVKGADRQRLAALADTYLARAKDIRDKFVAIGSRR